MADDADVEGSAESAESGSGSGQETGGGQEDSGGGESAQPRGNRVVAQPGGRAAEPREPQNRQERRAAWKVQKDRADREAKDREISQRELAELRSSHARLTKHIESLTSGVGNLVDTTRAAQPKQPTETDKQLAANLSNINAALAAIKDDPSRVAEWQKLTDARVEIIAEMKAQSAIKAALAERDKSAPKEESPVARRVYDEFSWLRTNTEAADMHRSFVNRLASKYTDEQWWGNPELRVATMREAAIRTANEYGIPIGKNGNGAGNGQARVSGTGGGGRGTGRVEMPAPTEFSLNLARAKFPNARTDDEAYQLWWDKYGKGALQKSA